MVSPEIAQKRHYEDISADYDAHYDDPWSRSYRRQFIDPFLLCGVELANGRALEAMCGSGLTTGSLLSAGARVTGLDISETSLRSFRRRWAGADVVCASLVDAGLRSESFDAVVVVAGLHHLQPSVDAAIDEIHRLLKPGGFFCFLEPHVESVAERFRRFWYRWDPLFLENEASIDLQRLKQRNRDRFQFVSETYGGNVAFLLVNNSMVFRIPLGWKRFYTPPLLRIERALGRLQGRRSACFVICQWRKR